MNLKAVITLLLALVFQLGQVMPVTAANAPCKPHAASCGCCKAAKSCHCATNGDSGQKPAPVPLNNGSVLKITAAKSSETNVFADPLVESAMSATHVTVERTGPAAGFSGVRMSVAFCMIVI